MAGALPRHCRGYTLGAEFTPSQCTRLNRHRHRTPLLPRRYVVVQVLVVLSPNLLQATDYWTLGRMLEGSGLSAESRLLRPTFVKLVFVSADVLALV